MKEQQFIDISNWHQKTFGKATPFSKLNHLREEINELVDDLLSNNPDKRLEFADCFILLFGAAASDGAKHFGGGGHKGASGFMLDYNQFNSLINGRI